MLPRRANRPSGNTRVSGDGTNEPSFADVHVANATPIASDAPTTSTTRIEELWRSNPWITVSEKSAPLDVIVSSDEMSHRPGEVSSAATIGAANASPTMANRLTRHRVTASSNSTTSNPEPVSVTTQPPLLNTGNARTAAAACINGDAINAIGPGPTINGPTSSTDDASSGSGTA